MSAENFDTRVSFIILSGLADMSVWLGCSGWPFLVGTSLKSMNKSLLVIFVVVIMSTLSYLTILVKNCDQKVGLANPLRLKNTQFRIFLIFIFKIYN